MSAKASRRLRTALVVVLVLAALYVAYRYTLHRMVEARLDDIRQQGYPVSLAELDKWYPQPPPGENAADVYSQAFSQYDEWKKPRLMLLPIVGEAKLPHPGQPLDAETKNLLEELLSANAQAIQTLHSAVVLTSARYPVEWAKGYDASMSHVHNLRWGARLLILEALWHSEGGRPDEAVRSLEASLAISRSLRNEPSIVSQLLRHNIDSTAVQVAARLLSQHVCGTNILAALSVAFTDEEMSFSTTRAIAGERCLIIDTFERLRRGRVSEEELRGLLGGNLCGLHPMPRAVLPCYKAAGFVDIDFMDSLNLLNKCVAASMLSGQQRRLAVQKAGDDIEDCLDWRDHFTAVLVPEISIFIKHDAKPACDLSVARVAIAIEEFRLPNTKLPDKLDELVPVFLAAVPPDPFDGQPLRYKKLSKGYVVYSVGDDGKDDGGDEKKDITFTVER
jgi:hypothetical protein